MKLINNFFKETDFKELTRQVVWNESFPMYLHDFVSRADPHNLRVGDWFATHIVYLHGKTQSSFHSYLSGLLKPILKWKTLFRVKINFYGYTDKIYEHHMHTDFDFKHQVALISLNTCNGFTRLGKKKIDSIANRAIIFNGHISHNSSTCTNSKGRWNINVNYR